MKMVLDTKKLDKALQDIANAIRKNIVDLTRLGVDMNRTPFKPYSEAYSKYKLEYTRGKRDISAFRIARASHVNLKLKGTMMHSMSVGKIKDGYEIFFSEKAMAVRAWTHHTGAGKMPKREFFGIAAAREKQLYEKYMPKDVARFA
jgi:hypothetical protein